MRKQDRPDTPTATAIYDLRYGGKSKMLIATVKNLMKYGRKSSNTHGVHTGSEEISHDIAAGDYIGAGLTAASSLPLPGSVSKAAKGAKLAIKAKAALDAGVHGKHLVGNAAGKAMGMKIKPSPYIQPLYKGYGFRATPRSLKMGLYSTTALDVISKPDFFTNFYRLSKQSFPDDVFQSKVRYASSRRGVSTMLPLNLTGHDLYKMLQRGTSGIEITNMSGEIVPSNSKYLNPLELTHLIVHYV